MFLKGTYAIIFFAIIIYCTSCRVAWAEFTISSESSVNIELFGFSGLSQNSLFKNRIFEKKKYKIDTLYRGLALLIVEGRQRFPLIIGEESFNVKISTPDKLPIFCCNGENEFFYQTLSAQQPAPNNYDFALLMVQAKQLLMSSDSVHSLEDLEAKKEEFHKFVGTHYENLKHSDMVRQFIRQYFLMHEYVDYFSESTSAAIIQDKFEKSVLEGVANWLEVLTPYIPQHEILNYCVSLYYDRSMVTLSSMIIDNFRNISYCPGTEQNTFSFPDDLAVVEANGMKGTTLGEIKGASLIAFVSYDCPVSMVEAVSTLRKIADLNKKIDVIVAPLQRLSEEHLAMGKMISNGKMLFINDEKWRIDNLPNKIKLPFFVEIGGNIH